MRKPKQTVAELIHMAGFGHPSAMVRNRIWISCRSEPYFTKGAVGKAFSTDQRLYLLESENFQAGTSRVLALPTWQSAVKANFRD